MTNSYRTLFSGRSKDNHMRAINKGQKVDFNDMVFFDDEYGNIETTKRLGVTAIHCPK